MCEAAKKPDEDLPFGFRYFFIKKINNQLFSSKFSTCSITLRNTSGLYCGG